MKLNTARFGEIEIEENRIFNLDNQSAAQVVLSGSGYDISYPMFKEN